MSIRVKKFGGYGTGARGDVTLSSGQINSYAPVSALTGRTVTIGAKNVGTLDDFAPDVEVLLHVSATKGSETVKLGEYAFARIRSVEGSVLTLDRMLGWSVSDSDLPNYWIQAVTVPNFETLTLKGALQAAAYNAGTHCGGVLALKCSKNLIFDGGRLDVSNKGIPTGSAALRPAIPEEATEEGRLFIHSTLPVMNRGNGVVMACARRITFDSATVIGASELGDPDKGAGEGGASILLVSDELVNFRAKAISTGGVSGGGGRGRCRIATRSEPALQVPSHELLYGHDLIHDPDALRRLGFRSFGDGRHKSVTNPTEVLCGYAPISRIGADLKTVETQYLQNAFYAPLEEGALVLFHVSATKSAHIQDYGRYAIRRITHRTASGSNAVFVLDEPLPVPQNITDNYWCQLVGIPQFESLTLRDFTLNVPAWNDSVKCGAILPLACSNLLSLANAKVLTEPGKFPGGRRWSEKNQKRFINQTNAVGATRMMLGEMNGAVLLLAKQIAADGSSRVGGEQSPLLLGGKGGESFLLSECKRAPGGSYGPGGIMSFIPPVKSTGKSGGSGFGGGQGANDGSNGVFRVTNTIPAPKGNDATQSWGARSSLADNSQRQAAPGYAGYSTMEGGDNDSSGVSGACILVVTETSPSELQGVMSSGGHGGGMGYGVVRGSESPDPGAAPFYPGFPGGGSGQLMYFHVGGDA